MARRLGYEPRLALLAFSTFGHPPGERSERVQEAVRLLDRQQVDFEYDGDMAADVALKWSCARLSVLPAVRSANVLVMPAFHSASISTKMLMELGGANVIGPMLVGLDRSVQIVPLSANDAHSSTWRRSPLITSAPDARSKRKLGASGPDVSAVGLGTNNFGGRIDMAASRRVVDKALELGVTLIDTADTYGDKGGSEQCLGEILGPRRKGIVLATKFGMPMDDSGQLRGASRRYIMQAVEASLRRLRTDWIDLYQLHRPDPQTPIAETLRALDDLVKSGKVRFIGCSNLSAAQLEEAQSVAARDRLTSFVCCQDEYSLLDRDLEKDRVPVMAKYGLGLLPYFPLASGLLTGKYQAGAPLPAGSRLANSARHADDLLNARNWRIVEALTAFAAARGHTLLELAMSWLAAKPYVSSIIAGATRPEQVEQNVAAIGWALSPAELAEIDRITA